MKKSVCCILPLLLAFGFAASSQIKVKIAGKQYIVPDFKDGTVAKPGYLKHISIPKPIEQSKYDIEIRYYNSTIVGSLINALVIKGNRDSLFAETYEISGLPARKAAKQVAIKQGNKYYVYYKKQAPRQLLDTVLANLIAHQLFVMQDQHQIYAHLKEQGVKINYPSQPNDCCLDIYIELKLKKHIRSFTYNYYPAADNLQIPQLADENLLMTDFGNLINRLHLSN